MDEATKSIVDEYDLPKTNDGGFKISGDKKDEIISKISDIEKQVVKLKSEPFLTFDELVSVSQNLIVHEIELCEKLLVKKPIEPKVKKVK